MSESNKPPRNPGSSSNDPGNPRRKPKHPPGSSHVQRSGKTDPVDPEKLKRLRNEAREEAERTDPNSRREPPPGGDPALEAAVKRALTDRAAEKGGSGRGA